MNGLAGKLLAKSAINKLVLFDPGEVAETLGDDGHLEVITTSGQIFNLDLRIRQGLADRRHHSIGLNHEMP